MNTFDMPVRKQAVEGEIIDPEVAASRNRDLMRMTVAVVVLAVVMAATIFCVFLPTPVPPIMP